MFFEEFEKPIPAWEIQSSDTSNSDILGSATLVIDLSEYKQAKAQCQIWCDEIDTREHTHAVSYFNKMKDLYYSHILSMSGARGQIWDKLLTLALQRTPEKLETILGCPLSVLMSDYFIELVENSIDAIISTEQNILYFNLEIFTDMEEKSIYMRFQDNGTGFNPEFLQKVASLEEQRAYIQHSIHSTKRDSSDSFEQALCGGRGRGLRLLIQHVISLNNTLGDYSPIEQLNPKGSISFSNGERGAEILVGMPLHLPDIAEEYSPIDAPILELPESQLAKANRNNGLKNQTFFSDCSTPIARKRLLEETKEEHKSKRIK